MDTLHSESLMNSVKSAGQATLCDVRQRFNRPTPATLSSMELFKEGNLKKVPGHSEGMGGKTALTVKA